jgi:hypothetical protein
MKENVKNSMLKFAWLFVAAMVAFTACKKDDPIPLIDAEDGIYVIGAGTALTDFDPKGLLKATNNEVGQAPRAGLMELYIAVKAGTDGFNIVEVTGGKAKTYGPGTDFEEVLEADKIGDEPREWFSRGSMIESTAKFVVPEDGLYHVVYDRTLNIVVVARVKWGIIGGATINGWGSSTPLTPSAFSLTEMSFQETQFIMTIGDFKFRYSGGELVRVNTNFGGTVAALVPGGDNISNAVNGYYTVTVSWSLANGTTATAVKTGDYTPPAYPAAMYISGGATAYGWAEPGTAPNAIMQKTAGGSPTEGIFWKICHLTGGEGFKLAASGWGDPNLGFAGINEFDADGITVTADGGGNMSVAESGMYMIVLNLRDNLKKVSIKAVEVFGIGDAFGGFDEDVAANKFTVDNVAKTVTSPALPASGNIRMYAQHPWIPSWWQAEFRVFGGVIEYRGDGGDQDAVAGTAGQVITLHFDDNTGSVAK